MKRHHRKTILNPIAFAAAAFAFLAINTPAANAQRYTFKVPSKLIGLAFESRMEIEDIIGTSHSLDGSLELKGKDKVSFSFSVPVASLRTGIDMRDKHLRSDMWLNAAKTPQITFRGTSARALKNGTYQVTGKFGMRGVERKLTTKVRVHRIAAARAAALGLPKANWLRLRATFKVNLSAHGIKIPKMAAAKVNDVWTVKVSVFAREVAR